jgi:mannose-6-phosphate isomerase-like protein (cupin superfamily)
MTSDRLEFPDGASVTVLDSPTDPAHAPLLLEFVVPPGAMPTAAHVHPQQEETYDVREGSLEILVGRSWSNVRAGQSATVPAGTLHAFRNRSGARVRFLNEHRPALRFEEYFRTVHRLAEAGEISGGFDVRSVLYASVLMKEYDDTMRPAGGMQRALISVLAAVGRLLGYKGPYSKNSTPGPPRVEEGRPGEASWVKLVGVVAAAIFAILALTFWLRRVARPGKA